MITEEQICEWKRWKGSGYTSALGEYTPNEFWILLDAYKELLEENKRLREENEYLDEVMNANTPEV
jgi:hypothetical protein